jgi:hypothetical protein
MHLDYDLRQAPTCQWSCKFEKFITSAIFSHEFFVYIMQALRQHRIILVRRLRRQDLRQIV